MSGHILDRTIRRASRRLLLAEFARRRRVFARLAGWSVLEAIPVLLSGQLIARAIDHGFVAGRPATGLGWLLLLGLTHLLSAIGTRNSFPALATIVEPLRDTLVRKIVDATLRRGTAGPHRPDSAAIARITQQVETVRDVTAGLLLIVRHVIFTMAAAILGLFLLAPLVAIFVLPPLVLSVAMFAMLIRALAHRQRAVVLAEERIAATANPFIEGMRDVVACGAQEHATTVTGNDIDAHFRATQKLARAGALRALVVALGAHMPIALILIAGPWLVDHGLTIGVILGAVTYVIMSLEPALRSLTQAVGSSGLRLFIALHRITEIITLPTPAPRRTGTAPAGHPIELNGLTFAYGIEPIVHKLSLTIAEGEHIAIAGPSGIGKSTLANLIAGIERPQSGSIRIGGVSTTDLSEQTRNTIRVLVPQEAYVFAGTTRENLTYLRPDVPQHELDKTVDALGLRTLLTRLGGYQAELHPTTLSAGERQLIVLARAHLSTAPIVILDEATCHLDPATEARAENCFVARPGTLIVIAHRISSARRAQRILLMDGSRPTCGTHEDLLTASPLYKDLIGHWHQSERVHAENFVHVIRPGCIHG